MKHSTKRTLGILICLAMVLAMLPLAAFAADTTTIYFDNSVMNWAEVKVYTWGGSESMTWPGNAMTHVEGNIWSYEVPNGTPNIIFNNGAGSQTNDLTVPTDGKNCCNGTQWVVYGSEFDEIEEIYTVAGDNAALFGTAWDPANTANEMTEVEAGIYSITYTDVPAGTYLFKVTNGTWTNSWGDPEGPEGNYQIVVEETTDVTIEFDVENTFITVTMGETSDEGGETTPSVPESSETTPSVPESSETTPSVPESSETTPSVPESSETQPVVLSDYIVAGQAALCGSEWDPADANNKMAVVSEGVFAITYKNVAAGTYEFKVTKGSWAENWGVGGPDGANVVAEVAEVSDVTITFVAATGEITVTVGEAGEQGPTQAPTQPSVDTESVGKSDYFVAGQPGLCGAEWDPAAEANRMDLNAEGICFITYKNVAAGEYQFKVTKGSWDANWGGDGPDGNYVINVTGGDVTISFNPATGAIVVVGAVETNPNTGDMSMASVAIALLAATAGVVAIVGKKKEF